MNANVGENNIVAENTIVEQELKEKTDVRKAVYGVFKRIIDILGGFVGEQLQNLKKGQCTWFQEDFARMEAGEDMTLTLFIRNDGKEIRREIRLKAPDIRSFWKAGLKAEDGMDYAVVLGTKDNYVETESFCILDK